MKPTVFSKSALVAATLSTSACVNVSTAILASPVGMSDPDSIRVFALNHPAEYTEIAVLTTHRFFASDTKVLDALRKSAGRVGANGILLVNAANSATQYHTGAAVIVAGRDAGTVVAGEGETKVDAFERAIAIRYTPVRRGQDQ
ncbi:MAG TPA: hypothetical protein VGM82_15365 [Gemmatimonadaceae bacterium]